jgi:hypothetical protein
MPPFMDGSMIDIIAYSPAKLGTWIRRADKPGLSAGIEKGGSEEPPPGCAGATWPSSWRTWPLRRRRLLPVSRS